LTDAGQAFLVFSAAAKVLPFFISLVVACLVPPGSWLQRIAISMAILFAVLSVLSAYGSVDPRILALPDRSQVNLFVWTAVALSVAQVVAAFLLVWGRPL
jgi:hypothetical protein